MRICSVSGWSGKTILGFFAIGVAGIHLPIAVGQTTNWGGANGDVWTRNGSWTNNAPNAGSIAVISGGSGSSIELREPDSPGTNSVGTIIITNPTYSQLIGGFLDTDATIAFGSTSAIGVNFSSDSSFTIGNDLFLGLGKVTVSVPGALAVNVEDGQELQFLSQIVGSGSMSIQRTGTLNDDATIRFGDLGKGLAVDDSTFSGGVVLNSGILSIEQNSIASGGSIVSGPLGTGTLTVNGGSIRVAEEFSSDLILHNYVSLNSNVTVSGGSAWSLQGTLNFGSNRELRQLNSNGLVFTDTQFAGSGTVMLTDSAATANISTGLTRTMPAFISSGDGTSTTAGFFNKNGAGTFAARHIRTDELTVNAGVAVISASSGGAGTLDIVGNNAGISRTGLLTIDSSAAIDLKNNDLVIDYSGTSPLGSINNGGTLNPTGHVAEIVSGFNSGSWNGNGIRTSSASSNQYALGYAEASDVLAFSGGTAMFGNQVVDNTTALIAFTYTGDADLDGDVDLDDFSRFDATGVGNPGDWSDGDFNYTGMLTLDDFSLLSANFGASPDLRRGGDTLQDLYVALLDSPDIYWGAKFRPDIWWRFEEFESMNLGPIPDMPAGFRASIPEPTLAAGVLLGWVACRRHARLQPRPGGQATLR
ncbi:MAG TPA: hypothetical protein PLD59_15145 [Tepidisphaeraceae bacterium]|nr:hypothetical protein [Tepidisphaeraceae bacterium]